MCYIFNVVRPYASVASESWMSLSHFHVKDAVFLRFTNSSCIFEEFSCACALFNNFQALSMIYRSPTSTILMQKIAEMVVHKTYKIVLFRFAFRV